MPEPHSDNHEKRDVLVTALRRHLPANAVLTSEEDLRPYECDGLSPFAVNRRFTRNNRAG
jgi:hypothetical protein